MSERLDEYLWFEPCTATSVEGCVKWNKCERGIHNKDSGIPKSKCIDDNYIWFMPVDQIVKKE